MDSFTGNTLSGLIGALFGAFITYWLASKVHKVSFSFDFHREFNTLEMGRHRALSEKLLKRYPNSNFDELGELNEEGVDSLYLIMRFYQRLGLAIKYHQISEALICEMFAENFYYWYYVCFKEHFVELKWAASPHIEALAAWFHDAVDLERHTRLRNKYEQRLAEWKRTAPSLDAAIRASSPRIVAGISRGEELRYRPAPRYQASRS